MWDFINLVDSRISDDYGNHITTIYIRIKITYMAYDSILFDKANTRMLDCAKTRKRK